MAAAGGSPLLALEFKKKVGEKKPRNPHRLPAPLVMWANGNRKDLTAF